MHTFTVQVSETPLDSGQYVANAMYISPEGKDQNMLEYGINDSQQAAVDQAVHDLLVRVNSRVHTEMAMRLGAINK